jgi:hypothetical protein
MISDEVVDDDSDFAPGKLPEKELRVLCENLGMLCQGEWQPRQLTLTDDFMMICLVGSDDILDKVPLVCVVACCHDIQKLTKFAMYFHSTRSRKWQIQTNSKTTS